MKDPKNMKKKEEWKKKIGKGKKKPKHSDEFKEYLRTKMLGNIPWNKGKTDVYSDETLKLMSDARKGKSPWNKGKKLTLSESTLAKIREKKVGKKVTMQTRIKMSKARKGMKLSEAHKLAIGRANKGKIRNKHDADRLRQNRANQIFPFKDSSIEVKIQMFLKELGIDFFTHQHISNISHSYQCDILIPSMNLVVECDGNYWHKYPLGREIDKIRTKELIEQGFKVLRLWESEIKNMKVEDFKERIYNG